MRAVLLPLFILALPGCDQRECRQVTRQVDRDWCFADEAMEEARRGDLQGALTRVSRIQAAAVETATIYRLIGTRVPGMDQATARELCTGLAPASQVTCLSDWDRPEVWGAGG